MQYQITELTKISIHTFLTEGDQIAAILGNLEWISIHTFLTEGDTTRSADHSPLLISIHTFLAEGDSDEVDKAKNLLNFNPHLPCGR